MCVCACVRACVRQRLCMKSSPALPLSLSPQSSRGTRSHTSLIRSWTGRLGDPPDSKREHRSGAAVHERGCSGRTRVYSRSGSKWWFSVFPPLKYLARSLGDRGLSAKKPPKSPVSSGTSSRSTRDPRRRDATPEPALEENRGQGRSPRPSVTFRCGKNLRRNPRSAIAATRAGR